MISERTVNGVRTVTVEHDGWLFAHPGWATPWTATHEPTGTVIETQTTDLDTAKQVVREQRPDLTAQPERTARYDVVRGRMSTARPGARRVQ